MFPKKKTPATGSYNRWSVRIWSDRNGVLAACWYKVIAKKRSGHKTYVLKATQQELRQTISNGTGLLTQHLIILVNTRRIQATTCVSKLGKKKHDQPLWTSWCLNLKIPANNHESKRCASSKPRYLSWHSRWRATVISWFWNQIDINLPICLYHIWSYIFIFIIYYLINQGIIQLGYLEGSGRSAKCAELLCQ